MQKILGFLKKHGALMPACDAALLLMIDLCILVLYPSSGFKLGLSGMVSQGLLNAACIFGCRYAGGLYRYVWRYGRSALYLRLILMDAAAWFFYFVLQRMLPMQDVMFIHTLSISTINLLATISVRLMYQMMYEYSSRESRLAKLVRRILAAVIGLNIEPPAAADGQAGNRINVAIVGAGRVGVMLAEELSGNPRSLYRPCCYIDKDAGKIGRNINGIPVISERAALESILQGLEVHEIVFALPDMPIEKKRALYARYEALGYRIKVYDYPTTQNPKPEKSRRMLREFEIEELLFRQPVELSGDEVRAFYTGRTVLISGGGGSIGSELCRQIARMAPKKLVVLDVYENGAYDIQQELKMAYGTELSMTVEIASVCDRGALEAVFAEHRPDIVLHAAAHKHVPLMERNCCEAVKNNVFGTLNIVETAEKYGVKKFTMISTDKAVNPTNVMGATKRMCEMIVQSRAAGGTSFSATRFGNVLGSNGSVIPLFKRQIAGGGPVTITDKRIIRYFMTIPEASQLVLESGAMAKNGELYVLDMGEPVKILELAENMIRLAGFRPYQDIDIVETGLRPGEKLYEELLIDRNSMDRTANKMIFVERDTPLGREDVQRRLDMLRAAMETKDDEAVRRALRQAVPTFKDPEEVNSGAAGSMEMKRAESAGRIAG